MTYIENVFPTHEYQGYKIRYGIYSSYGATIVPGGINFSVHSFNGTRCSLVLFQKESLEPFVEIPFQGFFQNLQTNQPCWEEFRIGKLFTMIIFDLIHEEIEYGFRMDGPSSGDHFGKPSRDRFNPSHVLLDPYAKAISGREVWGKKKSPGNQWFPRARIIQDDYNWEFDRQLEIPLEKLIIYEMHVRGFTKHPSSKVAYPGTFNAIHQKIPYLKELGVNCIELMPIAEFDEFENSRRNLDTEELLLNYWGYNPIGFFAPKAGYAASGKFKDGTMVADELKTLVKTLHHNGIEIILDVVFNHTGEGNEFGPTLSFKGIDNATYYLLTPDGWYYNFSGTGNTLNCNNPMVRNFLIDCLRYWVAEYHIDGFRFDLAAILGRDSSGAPMSNPPLLESLSFDPILAKCKLIAESWDAGGLYQVGSFPAYGRWAEWNGRYRDIIRKFVRGDYGMISDVAECLMGSPHLYQAYNKTASVNFITCHDGFTLNDLVSYNDKHNEANLENNRDGSDDNNNWNCGIEGPTDDEKICSLRKRQIKNFIAILMLSQGIPMISMGDEMGRTLFGNNNNYCHDNETNWLDWSLLEKNPDIFRFFKYCIAFRKKHSVLCKSGEGFVDWYTDWSGSSRKIVLRVTPYQKDEIESIYIAINMDDSYQIFDLPELAKTKSWFVFVNTGMNPKEEICPLGQEIPLVEHHFLLESKSMCILVEKEK